MHKIIEAVIDRDGQVRLLEEVRVAHPTRALVLFPLDDEDTAEISRVSEFSLAEDWDRPEEDEAWSHLQQVL